MNRLTKRTPNGVAYLAIAETLSKKEQEIEGSKPILEGIYAIFQRLAAYEDTELTPEEFIDLKVCLENEGDTGGTIRDLIELMQYRKLEFEGKLIILPCKVGDTVYCINNAGMKKKQIPKIKEYIIDSYTKGEQLLIGICDKETGWMELADMYNIGKTVFLTLEEAEKALSEDKQ